MRILIVTHGFPPDKITGTEWHSYLLAKELSKRHEIHVFSRGSTSSYDEHKYNFHEIPITKIDTPMNYVNLIDAYSDEHVALSFSRVLEEFKPEVIHIQHCIHLGLSILETAIERSIPILLFLHDFYFMCNRVHLLKADDQVCSGPKNNNYCSDCNSAFTPSLTKSHIRSYALKKYEYVHNILSKIDLIATPSEFVKKTFENNFSSIGQIVVLPLGLDLSFVKNFHRQDRKKFTFGYIGSTYHHKGIHILIEAFKLLKLKNIQLQIYGDGDPKYLKILKSLSSKNIIFLGSYSHDELSDVLSEIDVSILPSICHESYSFTIREALSVGIPVIVSDLEAQSSAITNNYNGLHFKNRDLKDLSEKMHLLATHTELYNKLSQNAQNTQIMSINEQTNTLEELYQKINR